MHIALHRPSNIRNISSKHMASKLTYSSQFRRRWEWPPLFIAINCTSRAFEHTRYWFDIDQSSKKKFGLVVPNKGDFANSKLK